MKHIILALLIVVGLTSAAFSQESWTARTSGTTSSLWGINYINNQYLIAGSNGTILTSSNGITWSARTAGTTNDLWGVAYGNNLYIATGLNGIIITSPDGITWTKRTSGQSDSLYSISYGNNQFVIVGVKGIIITSPDGITWTSRTSGTTLDLWSICYANNQFVAVGNGGIIITSPDGIIWTKRTSGTPYHLLRIVNSSNQIVATGSNGTIVTSADGITWTKRTSGTTSYLFGVSYGNNQFIATGLSGTIISSLDGITWTTRTSGTTGSLYCAYFGDNLFMVAGQNGVIRTSQGTIPQLAMPENAATNVSTAPTLTWSTIADAVTYRVQVSTESAFSTTIFDNSTLTSGTSTITGLINNTKYYWRSNAHYASTTSYWSEIHSFTTIISAPSTVTLTVPASGATNIATMPTLSWTAGAGGTPAKYLVKISTSSDFSTTVINDSTPSLTYPITTPLSNNTTYYWEVAAKNANSTSSYATSNFTTILGAPVLTSPATASANIAVTPTLSWESVTGATTYRVQVSTNSTFATTVVDDATLTTTSKTITTDLANSTNYFWRVSATNASGTSAYSSVFNFSTIIAAPGAVTLTSPGNSATNVTPLPTFTWTAGTGGTAAIYLVKVSTSSAFDSFVINDSTTSLSYGITTPFSSNTTYFWQVAAKNLNSTVYSATSRFTTIVAAPGSITITAPENGAVNVAVLPTLEWTLGSGGAADKYLVKVSTSSAFSTLLINDSTTNPSYEIATALSNNTTYFWKVAAKNTNSTSGYTSANFSTIVAAPGALTLTAPALGATNVVVTPTLEWTPGTGGTPALYLVKVSTSSDFSTFVINDSTTSLTYPISTPLSNSTTYYWEVAAKNANSTGSYATSNFSTIVAAPGALTLTTPAYSAANVAVTPTLEWTVGTGGTADKYLVKVSTSSDFSTLVINDSTTNPSYEIAAALSNNTRYYWEVAAKNANSIGSYSTSFFTTIVALPGAVTLISPTTNELNIAVLPTLTWTAGTGGAPVKYLISISTSSDFSSTVLDDSTAGAVTSYTLASALTYVNKYYWSVAAKNAAGIGEWVTDSFTTIKAETHFKFTSVTGNSMLILVKQDITPKVNGELLAAGDEIGVFTQNGLCVGAKRWTGESNISIVAWGDNEQTGEIDGALPGDSLLFRVWDSTAAQEGIAKVTWQPVDHVIFTRAYTYDVNASAGLGSFAAIVASEVPALRLPVTNAAGISLTPTLLWSSALNAVSYRVQVSSTSTFDYLNSNDSLAETSDLVSPPLSYGIKYFWRVNAKNAAGGISAWAIDSFTTTAQRTIALTAGWNMISLNVIPHDSNTVSVFSSMKHLIIVKNTGGDVYWPGMGVNTIGSVRLGEGYQVYTTAVDTLKVIGTPVDVSVHPIALNTGWYILGFLPDADMPINSALDNISSAIKIVKNNVGEAYWPAFGINDIGSMRVGQGYQVYLTSPATLTYPSVVYGLAKSVAVASGIKLPKAKHFVYAGGSTGNNATLMLKNVVENEKPIADSSEIAVYSSSGALVGSGVVINGKTAFPIWGDNPMTKEKDGLSASEAFTFKVWTPSGEEFSGTYIGTGSSGYTENAIMEGDLSVHRAAVITRCALANAYPNPFRGNVRITFDVAAINGKDLQNVEINVYDVRGVLVHQIVKDMYKAGHYTVSWDGSDRLGSNMYIVQMKAEQFSQKMKLFRVK